MRQRKRPLIGGGSAGVRGGGDGGRLELLLGVVDSRPNNLDLRKLPVGESILPLNDLHTG